MTLYLLCRHLVVTFSLCPLMRKMVQRFCFSVNPFLDVWEEDFLRFIYDILI